MPAIPAGAVRYDAQLVLDEETGQQLVELRGQLANVYARGTTTKLTLLDVDGFALANPITITPLGTTPTFYTVETATQADLVSGTTRLPIWSPQGLEEAAATSAAAAQVSAEAASLAEARVEQLIDEGGAGGGGGTSDHGQLAGLEDDDHPQYLTSGRAMLLFPTPSTVDGKIAQAIATSSQADRDRANHFGTQSIASVFGLGQRLADLDTKVAAAASGGALVLSTTDPVPPGTPAGTLIIRTTGTVPEDPDPDPVGVRPAVVEASLTSARSTSTNTLVIAKPAGVVDGDLLVAVLHNQNGGNPFAMPGGFVQAHTLTNTANIRSTQIAVYPVQAAGTVPASFTFTCSGVGRAVGVMFRVTGVKLADPLAGANTTSTDLAPVTQVVASQVATDAPLGLALHVAVAQMTAANGPGIPTTITPEGATKIIELPSSDDLGITRSVLSVSRRDANGPTPVPETTWTWGGEGAKGALTLVLRGN